MIESDPIYTTGETAAGTRLTEHLNSKPLQARGLYLAVMFPLLAYATIHIVRFASVVSDENIYVDDPRGVRIISIIPGGASDMAGLEVGDVIVAVNGREVRNAHDAMVYIVTGAEGNELAYTVERGGRRLTLAVVLADYGLPMYILVFVLTGGAFMLLSAFVILRRPAYPVARLFGWATLLTGFFLATAFDYPSWQSRDFLDSLHPALSRLAWGLGFGAMYHTVLLFPKPRYSVPLPRAMVAALYLIPWLGLSLVFFGLFPFTPFIGFISSAFIIATVELLLGLKLKLPVNPERGPVMLLVRAAGILAAFMLALIGFIQASSGWQGVLIWMLAVPMLLFAVIVRHRIFDLYLILRPSSHYHMLKGALNVALLLMFGWTVSILSTGGWNIPVPEVTGTAVQIVDLTSMTAERRARVEKNIAIIASVLLAIALWRIRVYGLKMLDRRFYRSGYDYRRALSEFSRLSTRYSDVSSLARAVVDDLPGLMHLKGAGFAYKHGKCFVLESFRGLGLDKAGAPLCESEGDWTAALAARGGPEPVDNLGARSLFAGTGVEIVTPVFVDKRLEVLLLLGEKLSGTNFTRDDIDLLSSLAINVSDALVTMNFYDSERERERLKGELEIARRIQLGTLPEELPPFPGLDVSAASLPAAEVGGDFYDFLARHDAITFLVGDVSGKGMSAALHLSRIQGIIRAIDSYNPSPWELLVRLNSQLFGQIERRAYVTLSALRIDLLKGAVAFLRAGHLPMLHYRAAGGEVLLRRPEGIGIGIDGSRFGEHLAEDSFALQSGDVFLFVTDGISEAVNRRGEHFELERLAELLRSKSGYSASVIKNSLLQAVASHSEGAEQRDDMTALVVKVR